MRVGRKRQLAAAIGAPDAWPLERHPAAAKRHLARIVAVTHRAALRIVSALRTHDLNDFFLHQLGQHAEADTDAEREQTFSRRS